MAPMAISRLQDQHDISDRTKKEYHDVLQKTLAGLQQPIEWVILHPNKSLQWYMENVTASSSGKLMLANAVTKMTKIYSQFASNHLQSVQRWGEIVKECNKEIKDRYKSHEIADDKLSKSVLYNELKTVYCQLRKDPAIMTKGITSHMQYILFTMLLSIKPKRADLGSVYLSVDAPVPDDKRNSNYIEINGARGALFLNRYKTAKTYGTLEEPLAATTVKIIRQSLEVLPRQYLIVDTQGNPYSNKAYSKFFTRACEKHFEKGMSASLWRKVFVNENVDFNLDPLIVEENARLMGHSVGMQMAVYRTTHAQIKRRKNPSVTTTCSGQRPAQKA